MIKNFDKSGIFRFLTIIGIIGTASIFLHVNQTPATQQSQPTHHDISGITKDIDRQVDSVLAHFHIEKSWCRKKENLIPSTDVKRIERKVLIPPEIIPVQVNHALNLMARRYDCRAIGSENLKENSVTIHIKCEEYIIETIILKTTKDLKPTVEKKLKKKV